MEDKKDDETKAAETAQKAKAKRRDAFSDFEPKKGRRVRFCYIRNGPVYAFAPATIVKVGRGERGGLDLKVDMSALGQEEPVAYEAVQRATPGGGDEQPNHWYPPFEDDDEDAPDKKDVQTA